MKASVTLSKPSYCSISALTTPRCRHRRDHRTTVVAVSASSSSSLDRRQALLLAGGAGVLTATAATTPGVAHADDFITTPSGLKYLDLRPGDGVSPQRGDQVSVHWSGFTKGYQGKRIDNTSVRDEPFEFIVGSGEAIAAFDEAVLGMRAGGVRRIEVPGDVPSLGYPRDRNERFSSELIRNKIFKYNVGPQPVELGGQRALDFVLDNPTLQDFNRTLLFDIKLLTVRSRKK